MAINRRLGRIRRLLRLPVKILRGRLFELSLLFCVTMAVYLFLLSLSLKTVVIFFRS